MGRNKANPYDWGEVPYLSIQCYSDHPEVYRIAELVADAMSAGKKRSHREKYLRPARKFIASLWMHEGDLFRWSTRDEHYGKNRKQVWLTSATLAISQRMMEMGYINDVASAIAPANASDGVGKAAIYCRALKFTNEMSTLTFSDVVLDPDLDRVTLRDENGKLVELSEEDRKNTKNTVSLLEKHSQILLDEPITKSDGKLMRPMDKHYFRRFRGSFKTGGRFYGGFTTWSKEERLQIRFKHGEPAFSLDLSSLHPNLLLRIFHRKDMYRPEQEESLKDPYEVPAFSHLPREVHKKLVAILLNSGDLEQAKRGLYNTYYWTDEEGTVRVKTYKGKTKRLGTKAFPGNKQEAAVYISAYQTSHPLMAQHIGSGIGSYLQLIDSEIIFWMITFCNGVGIPILPVHDEVVFPIRDLRQILEFLTSAVRFTLAEGRNSLQLSGYENTIYDDPADFGVLPTKISYFVDGKIQEQVHIIDMEYKWWHHEEEIEARFGKES